jgi:hypothetical protein
MQKDLSAVAEFAKRFATEAACRDYLIQLRWPEGFRCPHCGGRENWDDDKRLVRLEVVQAHPAAADSAPSDHIEVVRGWLRVWGVEQPPHESLAMALGRALGMSGIETARPTEDADMCLAST